MNTNQIMITLNEIRNHNPCRGGWETLLRAKGKNQADDEPFPMSDILDTNGLDDALWCLRCKPEHDALWRRFAVWAARQVQHLMTDERSVQALEVAERYARGEASDEELGAARAAALAALGADRAAEAAAWAAYVDAARTALGAYRARTAAEDAVEDAQSKKLRTILDAGEWVEDK